MHDLTPETLAELREKAQRANNWGRWARWTDQDGASHMRGLFMVGNLAAVIPIGEMWVETDPDDVNPIAECYTPELADFIAAANPAAVLALLDAAERLAEVEAERDALAAKVERVRALHRSIESVTVIVLGGEHVTETRCRHCSTTYPCPTLRALDGAQ